MSGMRLDLRDEAMKLGRLISWLPLKFTALPNPKRSDGLGPLPLLPPVGTPPVQAGNEHFVL
jgi:hypothetical protein